MRIALTMRVTRAAGYDEPRDSISHDWLVRLAEWEATPILVPNRLAAPERYLNDVAPALLVLTGGDDIGDTPERDATETRLLAHALATGVPVLGVCRGLQLINRHLGGHEAPVDGHVRRSHAVSIRGAWQEFYGATATVNSFHALGIPPDGLGEALQPVAVDDGGHIEGVILPGRAAAAVMWHPERPGAPDGDRRLVMSLAAVGARR